MHLPVGRFVVALRCGGVAVAGLAAALNDDPGVSRGWQAAVFGVLAAWAAFFSLVALRRELTFPLVAGDALVVGAALALQDRLISREAVLDETTWGVMLAGTALFVVQTTMRPAAGVPLVVLIIAAYVAGAPAVTSFVRALIAEALVIGAVMALLRRGGRRADEAIRERDRDRLRAMVEAARRADERHQRVQLHDSVLAVLTMVGSGAVRTDTPGLRRAAARALDVLTDSAGPPPASGRDVDLMAALAELAATMAPDLEVDLDLDGEPPVELPEPVGLAIVGAAREALRNVRRHANVTRAAVRVHHRDGTVSVEITDRGAGFDMARVPGTRLGIRRSIVERMGLVGGAAEVTSRPSAGTKVALRWPDG
ncbi:ATP-binding protein [Actinomadura sp. KC06]|uniref:sensor histidine kinase n=1 Tax=Actinomadura sp. KC06 TaxID=2530369 RepID=UPI00104986B5|nr:ATP-binding protein [Actinomadura sp. KC06]TDD36586.1 ATP-binding protein [Actinomadura sp. KC06]